MTVIPTLNSGVNFDTSYTNYFMPAKRKDDSGCTTHKIFLCEENKQAVLGVKAQIELKHQSSIDQAINFIVEEWREMKGMS